MKQTWKPGNMLYPLPAVMVTCTDGEGHDNVLTVAWTGTTNSDPAGVYISVRKERHSYEMIKKTGEFVINLTTEKLARATDFCGVRSGRDIDKFKACNLTKEAADVVKAPMLADSPVNLECKVISMQDLGSHTMFLAEVAAVHIEDAYMDANGKFDLAAARPLIYNHGEYYGLGEYLGKFGFSVKKQ